IANTVTLGLLNIIRVIQVKYYVDILPFKKDYLYPLMIFLVAFYFSFLATNYAENYFLLIMSALVYSILYFSGIYYFGLTKDEDAYVKDIINKLRSKNFAG